MATGTIVNRPNRDALNRALDIYRDAMRPFIVRCLRRVRGGSLEDIVRRSLNENRSQQFQMNRNRGGSVEEFIDIGDFPSLIGNNWRASFDSEFGRDGTVRSLAFLIAAARNDAAHPGKTDLEPGYTQAHIYHIADMLGRIGRSDSKRAVDEINTRLFAPPPTAPQMIPAPEAAPVEIEREPQPQAQPQPDRRAQTPKSAAGDNSQGMASWRDVIMPNQDVINGSFTEAEFAADLQQVHDGRADATEYGNPVGFFDRTYITPGIRTLLVNTLKRIGGRGGDPVIQTKTGFGGGKTHSLIALYHLIQNMDALINPPQNREESEQTARQIRGMMQDAEYDPDEAERAKIAVLDGTFLSTTDEKKTDSGDPLNTLWGVMAYQLDGQAAYDIVGAAARQGTAPGGQQLDALFDHVGPCVILMDEIVAYVRNAGGMEDSIYTFIHALTTAARRNHSVALIVTLPDSIIEAGGEKGEAALSRLDEIFRRIEANWEPLEVNEAFEVVRRRLFGALSKTDEAERDRVCEAFVRMYRGRRQDFPQGVSETRYLQRMKECYPIHPEIFDRLYEDWSANPRMQRTRGVLRIMANWISRLYADGDQSPLILPGTMPLSDPSLSNEFTALMAGRWDPVLSEADRAGSRTDLMDISNQRFGRVNGAAKRVARTVFLGSAESGAVRGIDARRIRLGVVQPGHGSPVYNDALAQMVGDLYFLYSDNDRHYFHVEENLNKVSTDRADALTERELDEFIVDELGRAIGRRSDVIVCPNGSGDVPEGESVRMVVLPPGKYLPVRIGEKDYAHAESEARDILLGRGDAGRSRRNLLVFLAAKSDDIRALRSNVRILLAWKSILNGERRIPNLENERKSQATSSAQRADESVRASLIRAYQWVIPPSQSDPSVSEYTLRETRTDAADSGNIISAAFDKLIEREELVEKIAPSQLANMLERYIWKNDQYRDHIDIDTLWNIMASSVYMHRLRDKSVLAECIAEGVAQSNFGTASRVSDDGSYEDLRYGEDATVGGGRVGELRGLLVNPDMATIQKEEIARSSDDMGDGTTTYTTTDEGNGDPPPPPPPDPPPTEIIGHITVRKTMHGDIDMNAVIDIRDEIVRNMGGGDVTISITINARSHDGFSQGAVRAVRENGSLLGLDVKMDRDAV